MVHRIDRLILSLKDDELELLCRNWATKRDGYIEVRRYGGGSDKGRDVVGFLSSNRHEGDWDNYQCKQYRGNVPYGEGLLALAKVFFWAWKGEFSIPRKFIFVAPKGVARKLEHLLDNPSKFADALFAEWNNVCASKITKTEHVPLSADLKAFILQWDFKNVVLTTVDDLVNDPKIKPIVFNHFGGDPGGYPKSTVPTTVSEIELPYVTELIEAYSEREGVVFSDHCEVVHHPDHGSDLKRQRKRFFEADAFQRFYRDNTSPELIENFREDIHDGIAEVAASPATDILTRIGTVMTQAATIHPSGPLARYAKVAVKQGVCHHFVNDGELTWKKP